MDSLFDIPDTPPDPLTQARKELEKRNAELDAAEDHPLTSHREIHRLKERIRDAEDGLREQERIQIQLRGGPR